MTGLLGLAACGSDEPAEGPARPAMVVQPGMAAAAASAYAGEVRAQYEPALAFRIGGKISRRLVDVGDRVKAGQALAELDAADVALQLEASRAQLASAESDLALATSELERYKGLIDRQLVSRSLYDERVSAQKAAEARVRQARAQAAVSGNQAAYAVLQAPKDGVIAQRLAEAGQVVAAGQTVFVLAQDGEREVAISVPEQSAADFVPGRPLLVELWSAPGKRFPGKLREIAPAADAQARTFAARVSFDAGDTRAEIGQSARVYALQDNGSALAVPLSALYEMDGKPALWVVDPDTARVGLRPVQVGPYGETMVPVTAGLQPGEWVVAAGVHLLLEGQRIKPIDRENRPVALAAAAPVTADAR
ncbi:efflux RND transporter periplasmic adaptor subunit [Arenimonas daejeonensis]|uniref:efflux RND transporter periplasmic adaptor subunit n=1 Tax=Arenimonas daejeonensis TaxID=370777 RepID=UPI001D14454C|nr:efflux RND transporter periplasmic adaptor subunit [Arenimonas daejeonensis]